MSGARQIPAYRLTPNDMKRAASALGCVLAVPHTHRGFQWRPKPDVILVTNNDTSNAWAQHLGTQASAVCLIRGRLRWVSTLQGQIVWYFGRHVPAFEVFFSDFGVTAIGQPAVTCQGCGRPFGGARSDARYCSGACRQQAYRQRGGES